MQKLFLFGDSITAGYYEQQVTDILTAKIQEAFPELAVVNGGIPGDTSGDGLQRLESFVLRYEPAFVTLFFGANDAAQHRKLTVSSYQQNLTEMIRLIGREKVLLLGPPYASQRKRREDRPWERLAAFAEGAEAVAVASDLPFINVFAEMSKSDQLESLFQEDGLHFSLAGYDFLANLMIPQLNQLRRKRE